MTLYWPLIAGTANVILKFSGSKEHRFEIMTGTWRYVRRYSWRPENDQSAGVTLPLEFRIDLQAFSRVKCNITVISLLLGKYTRTFVPRLPGIPDRLYFPPPSASGNITSRGFPGTSGQTFWYISLKAIKYLYNILFS